MAGAFGLTEEKLFMTYANTTGMMHMLAEQSEGLLTGILKITICYVTLCDCLLNN